MSLVPFCYFYLSKKQIIWKISCTEVAVICTDFSDLRVQQMSLLSRRWLHSMLRKVFVEHFWLQIFPNQSFKMYAESTCLQSHHLFVHIYGERKQLEYLTCLSEVRIYTSYVILCIDNDIVFKTDCLLILNTSQSASGDWLYQRWWVGIQLKCWISVIIFFWKVMHYFTQLELLFFSFLLPLYYENNISN